MLSIYTCFTCNVRSLCVTNTSLLIIINLVYCGNKYLRNISNYNLCLSRQKNVGTMC